MTIVGAKHVDLTSADPDDPRPSRYGLWTEITRYGVGRPSQHQVAGQLGERGISHSVKGAGSCC
jgi:hypothetical protein